MDPPAEIEIPEGDASPTDDGNRPARDAVSMVLDNGDLLLMIMFRLGLPTTLVRSILVCRRWFSVASDPILLRWFRGLHPPRLLGFYVATRSTTNHTLPPPRFVPMPPPESDQPPQGQERELAAAVRMAESYSSLEAYDGHFTCIDDLQNDTMLVSGFRGKSFGVEVHWPLSPHRDVVAIPMTPYDQFDGTAITAAHFILKDHGGRSDYLVYVWLSMGFLITGEGEHSVKYKAHIYVLQEDGQWHFHSSAAAVLPSPSKSDSRPLLVGTKIYLEHTTSIAALDLNTSSFSAIPLPEGMEQYDCKDMVLAAYYGSGIVLIHLDEDLQLKIWLHVDGTLGWLPIVLIRLPEMFETLGMTGWTDDDEPATLFQTAQMGDFVEFVFLKLGKCAFCLDTRRMVLRKVYEVTEEDQTLEQLHPLMTTWPPNFPALKGDHLARNVS